MKTKLQEAFEEVTELVVVIDHTENGTTLVLEAVHGDTTTQLGLLVGEEPRTGTTTPLYRWVKRKE